MVRRKGPSDLDRYVRFAHVGVQFALIVVLGILGGSWLDRRLSTAGTLTLVGTFLGASIGFYVLYRETQRSGRPDSDHDDPDHPRPRPPDRDPDDTARRP
ncbi:MAG: AtpZ/AtpI family protein [Candidatus Eiseniibacteriota bacterium]